MPKPVFLAIVLGLTVVASASAHSGCCSHHDGVCGCACCDGTPLSATCLPYYPGCGPGGSPSAPFGLTAVAGSSSEAELSWLDGSTDQTGFRIDARTDSGSFATVASANASATSARIGSLLSQTTYTFRVFAQNAYGDSPPSNEATATTSAHATGCTADATTLCLNNSARFQVRATYDAGGGRSGAAQAVVMTSDTGYLWFFSSANVEVVIKVINGCGLNDHYWVFAGGLTNVAATITVTDTQAGTIKTYTNPQNTAFLAIQDTSAFDTCP
jgi:hypothetical protein